MQTYNIECIFTNTSYGMYGKVRDEKVIELVSQLGCKFESHKDFLLVEPHEVEQRKVFTPFYKLWQKFLQAHPENLRILPPIEKFSQLSSEEQTQA